MVKCHLVNTKVLGQRCGFGEGATWEDAKSDAIALAKARGYDNAHFNTNTNTVDFTPDSVYI